MSVYLSTSRVDLLAPATIVMVLWFTYPEWDMKVMSPVPPLFFGLEINEPVVSWLRDQGYSRFNFEDRVSV